MSNLYDIDFSTFSQVIDESLNYHYMETGSLDNLFDNYTHNIIKYVSDKNSLLDFGCGYGGPARLINRYCPHIDISCLTNSRSQYECVSKDFKTYHQDGNDFECDKKFDIITFFDSLCHMDANKIIPNLHDCTDAILIKDYVYFNDDIYYTPRWEMTFRSEANWKKLLTSAGFNNIIFNLNDNVLVEQSHSFWRKGVEKVSDEYRQMRMLRDISKTKELKPGKGHCVIYATK